MAPEKCSACLLYAIIYHGHYVFFRDSSGACDFIEVAVSVYVFVIVAAFLWTFSV